jgi:membrane-associated phospholipid phosphatase
VSSGLPAGHLLRFLPSAQRGGRPIAERVVAWPGTAHVARTLWRSLLLATFFALVYGGADAFARLRAHRVDLSLPLDGAVPFVPATTLVYSSLYAMFAFVPFILRTDQQVRMLARVMALEIVIAAPFFLALPMAEPQIPGDLGRFAAAFRFADLINLQHNQFPSLHATFAFTVAAVLGRRCRVRGRMVFAAWAAGIAAATLLTRQHVIVDVAGALALTSMMLPRSDKSTGSCRHLPSRESVTKSA